MDVLQFNGATLPAIKLLGKGKGGYSWLVERDVVPFVVKQIHHEPCDYYQFGDKLAAELNDYRRLRAADIPVPALLDVDAPGERLLKAYVPGPTCYDLVRDDALPPSALARVRELSETARAAGLNLDWFPTNFIPEGDALWYVDYECNAYDEKWSFETWGVRYWSRTPDFLAHLATH